MYQEIFRQLKKRGMLRCATVLTGEYKGSKLLYSDREMIALGEAEEGFWQSFVQGLRNVADTQMTEIAGIDFFVELFRENPRMVICGGGHVSQPVCKVAKMLGFYVTIVDDREEFVTSERFPDADERICLDFQKLSETIPSYDNTYYVIVTRGHSFDGVCVRQILSRPFAYLGMIGSKSKVAATLTKLRQEGYPEELLARMHSPIGLNLGGETPEEIMISILAEIVQVKNERHAAYLPAPVVEAVMKQEKGTMVTIMDKAGSSPRGKGSKMWVREDGTAVGTIGGGTVEYRAIQEATSAEHMSIREYDLSNKDSSKLGMICGGCVKVLFEKEA